MQDELNVGEYDDMFDEAMFAGHAPIAHTNTMIQEQGTNQSQPPEGSAVKDAEEQEARARYNAARARCALPPLDPQTPVPPSLYRTGASEPSAQSGNSQGLASREHDAKQTVFGKKGQM